MKTKFLFLALLVSMISFAQVPSRASNGIVIGDPIGTASDPTGVKAGHIYWNDTLKKFRQYNGTVWSDIAGGGGLLESIVNPLDTYFGTKLKPITANDGFYTTSSNNKWTGYLSNITGVGTAVIGGFTIINNSAPFVNETSLLHYGTNYYQTALRNNGSLYFTNDLYIAGGKNTSDIVFKLGNTATATNDLTAQDNVLQLNADRSITAPSLTTALITSGGVKSLITKEYADANYLGGGTWGSITGTLSNQTDLQSALDAKQDNISLTTTGTSGAATFVGSTLNIPNYASGGDFSEFMTSSGTRVGGDLVTTIGDYDSSGNGTKIIVDDLTGTISLLGVSSLVLGSDITSDTNIYIDGTNGARTLGYAGVTYGQQLRFNNILTSASIIDLPDASGTIALTSNITGTNSGTNTGDNAVNTLYSGLVTNATHTGDATGATALTLATVNSNVGSFTNANVTVNAKGLITAVSNGAGGGSTTFTALTDTPASYTGNAFKSPRVNAGGTALEFKNIFEDLNVYGSAVQLTDGVLFTSAATIAQKPTYLSVGNLPFYRAGNFIAGTNYQAPLVSGTNIKTINGTTILGSGDIVVSGGTGTIGGSIADNQIAVGAATANSIEGTSGLTYDGTTLGFTGGFSGTGNSTLDVTGSANLTPRTFGFSGLAAGNAASLQFGDPYNTVQTLWGAGLVMRSYNTLVLDGGTFSATVADLTIPNYATTSDESIRLLTSNTRKIIIRSSNATARTQPFLEFQNNGQEVLASINTLGQYTGDGSLLTGIVDLTTAQTITGTKTFNTTDNSTGILAINNSFNKAIQATNNSTGYAFHSTNNSSGTGIYSLNDQSGNGIVSNGSGTSTGFNYVGQNSGSNTFTVNKEGDVIANTYNGITLSTLQPKASATATGTAIDMSGKTLNNFGAASAATVFTMTNIVVGGEGATLVNGATEPTVTGATKIPNTATFIPSTNMVLFVKDFNGTRKYYFMEF